MKGKWINIYNCDLLLRSWWVDSGNECEYASIVLPEVFGINNWIRNFSERLSEYLKAQGHENVINDII